MSSSTTAKPTSSTTADAAATSPVVANAANAADAAEAADASAAAEGALSAAVHSLSIAVGSVPDALLPAKLQELAEHFPELHATLSPGVILACSKRSDTPFPTNSEYMEHWLAYFHVRRTIICLQETIRGLSTYNQILSKNVNGDADYMKRAGRVLGEVLDFLAKLMEMRLAAHASQKVLAPRLVRMCQAFNIPENRLVAVVFIVLHSSEMFAFDPRDYSNGDIFLTLMARYTGLTLSDAIQFVDPSRSYIKEGLINLVEDAQYRYPPSIPQHVFPILFTEHVSTDVRLKVDGTTLAKILDEEDGDEATASSAQDDDRSDDDDANEGQESADEGEQATSSGDATVGEDTSDDFTLVDAGKHSKKTNKKKKTSKKVLARSGSTGGPREQEEDKDLYDLLREQLQFEEEERKLKEASGESAESATDLGASASGSGASAATDELKPYTTNLGYLSDHFEWVSLRCRVSTTEREVSDDNFGVKDVKGEQQLREMKAKEKMQRARCVKRMELTVKEGTWLPRLERLVLILQLDDFERQILWTLAGNKLSNKVGPEMGRWSNRGSYVSAFTVGQLLHMYSEDFEDEVGRRKYFYKNARLVKEGVIRLADSVVSGELNNSQVEMDRRMLDFVVGLETEVSEMLDGSHLYTPNVKLDQVILAEDQKKMVIDTVTTFERFKKLRKRLGFDELVQGAGILLMFYGKSGTGKTMLANALASHLGKRILLINFPSLGSQPDQVIKFIFREAKLTDAILFFDECEALFKSRELGGSSNINLLLTEIEQHGGLSIMATNRPVDIDEAMHRRITLAIEFQPPTNKLREQIWKAHVPNTGVFDSSIDWHYLAAKYELVGGLIRNSVLSALSFAVARSEVDNSEVMITQADLERGALLQLKGRLNMVDFDRRVVPTRGLEDIVLSNDVRKRVGDIIAFEKARQVLISEWGFSEAMCRDQGTSCLFVGPPGTGKTICSEAIGLETGKALKIVNCGELVSKWVGETGKNIEAIFKEARAVDAILVFDDAEGLFGSRTESTKSSTDRYANMDTSILLYHMERFPGVVILSTNIADSIDRAFLRRFRFIVEFKLPDAAMRAKLFRDHLPTKVPIANNIDFTDLAQKFSQFSGANIKNVCFKAASRAALRPAEERRVLLSDLEEYCVEEEFAAGIKGRPPTDMFS
ncbi:hypothetical protein CAOG_02039 [Capsaspora owczarzaki ATCC 30864]|uniref:AAA+ ATPase domain-containing protein n=1 Tax=Capsaspora owczarzaki (strain ATCC 30864) TaxID=595528 RepID=A0A0D2X1H0_CAPO3|nr:hypothetical protein CAOG_02039 [Capsaspora owczarzaki ATCC 30864]KJE90794.1 hypothetical protein CAOG_002039 [Capsaspora owczarzaki ATCC 30864]|eukprot:XP_004348789.2 hypothetical protein CAOG_02039 [Capsaspora owczarzaki ATCC 30864]